MTQTEAHANNQDRARIVRFAEPDDITLCKRIADQHRAALGFLTRGIFEEAFARRQLLVASGGQNDVVGFLRFNHRKQGFETAIYDIAVERSMQRQGIGRVLIAALVADCRSFGRTTIVLKCPEGLAAHSFYERLGFVRCGVEVGRRRSLVIWRRAAEVDVWSL